MATNSFSSCSCRLGNPNFSRLKVQLPIRAGSQDFRDEGNYSNAVDANMGVLRYRIEKMRMKERLDSCDKLSYGNAWTYRTGYDAVQRRKSNLPLMSFELATIIGCTIGLVFFVGTLCIVLAALISHLGHLF